MIIYLYKKTHHVKTSKGFTLNYLGKTCKDPFKYPGSGTHWKRHCDKYGYGMDTMILGKFNLPADLDALIDTALNLSATLNIVDSDEWANIIVENGLDGGIIGSTATDETKARMSVSKMGNTCGVGNTNCLGRILSDETKLLMRDAKIGMPLSAKHKANLSIAKEGNTNATQLSDDEVRIIYSSPKLLQELAIEFGVSFGHISGIKLGKSRSKATKGCQPAPKRGLTDEQVREIYSSPKLHSILAIEFGVSDGHISAIKLGWCHRNITGAGQPTPKNAITDDKALAIYNSTGSHAVIAKEHGVSRGTVSNIKLGKTHSNATGHVSPIAA